MEEKKKMGGQARKAWKLEYTILKRKHEELLEKLEMNKIPEQDVTTLKSEQISKPKSKNGAEEILQKKEKQQVETPNKTAVNSEVETPPLSIGKTKTDLIEPDDGEEADLKLETTEDKTEINKEDYKNKCGECGAYFNEFKNDRECPECSFDWSEPDE